MRKLKRLRWVRVIRRFEPTNCLMQHALIYRRGALVGEVMRYFSLSEVAYANLRFTGGDQ